MLNSEIFVIILYSQITLTLKAPIATKVVYFSRLLKSLQNLYGKQCGPGSTLFASILNSSVMLGNYLQQTASAGDVFRCIFFLALKRHRVKRHICIITISQLKHDLPTSVNGGVISPFLEGFISTKFCKNKTLVKIFIL